MDGRLLKVQSLMAKGELGRAAELLRHHVLDADRPNPKAMNLLGVCEARQGHREMAREVFNQVLRRSPGNPSALTNLGNLSLIEGDHHAAREYYNRALRQNVFLPEPRFNLVLSYQDMGHFEKAMTAYEEYVMIAKTAKWSKYAVLVGLLLLLAFLLKR